MVVGEDTTSFNGLFHFDLYLLMLSVKQIGIKYHFLSLYYSDQGLNPRPLPNTLPTMPVEEKIT